MNLNDSQHLLSTHLLIPNSDPQMIKDFKPVGSLNMNQAIEIYHRSYFLRLSEVLRKTFEATHWVLGHELFKELCQEYISSQPSTTYILAYYGESFPEFIKTTRLQKQVPFLYDLARFEWLFKEVYHRPHPDPLTIDSVESLTHSDDFKVQFIDAMEIFQSPYSIYEIWCRRDEPPYRFEDIDWTHPEAILIYKKNHTVETMQLDLLDADILCELKEGISITSALADYSGRLTADHIAHFFMLLTTAGVVEDILILSP